MQCVKILEKYLFPSREVPSDADLPNIEDKIGVKLPNDISHFLSYYHRFETFIGEEYVRLWSIEELVESNAGFEIQNYYPASIGIGGNGGGELIVLENLGADVFRVILTTAIGMDSPIEIGESFTDFLVRLDDGRNWFG